MKTILLQDWKFILDNGTSSAEGAPSKEGEPSDDSQWEDIVVPHDWAVTRPFSKDNSSGTGYLPGGTGWYCAVFTVPSGWQGKDAFVYFDGVYKNSQVWVNGHYLGKRPSGYASFRYSIGHCLREEDNVIAVKVTHEDIADSRWYTGSGIYRKVYLRFCDRAYIDEAALFVHSQCRPAQAGVIEADVIIGGKIRGDVSGLGNLNIKARLTGRDGAKFEGDHPLPSPANAADVSFTMTLKIPKPELWSPDEPNLYTLDLELHSQGGAQGGAQGQPLSAIAPLKTGIRGIAFDPDKGFFLNNSPMKIKGVCVHHDAGCLGAAVWPDVWRRRLEKLKAAGCNAIRMSHNPHMPELYDLCDEMGFLVMDEAFDEWEGCKNKWWQGHNVYPPKRQGYSEDFPQWHEEDLAAMVLRDRNHPSVIMWSVGNEIDYPNDPYVHPIFQEMTGNNDANKPAAEMQYNKNKPNMERLAAIAADLVRIVKKYDTTRPVTLAAAFPELSSRLGFLDALDVAGYNYKEQFYEEDHKRFPKLPILGSENSHSIAAWKAARDNEYIGGQFLWTGIDYLGEAHGWPARCSGAGLLDTAGNEKTAFFRRQALWLEKPVLYLASRPKPPAEGPNGGEIPPWDFFRCWDYLPGESVEVVCYTNLERAELFCNGKSLGAGTRNADSACIVWTIPFERGELSARGIGITDTIESALPPVLLSLREWKAATSGPDACGGHDACGDKDTAGGVPAGKYRIAQIEAALLDEKRRLCVRGNAVVNVTLSGPARFLGMENGDIADCTEYRSHRRHLHQGRAVIYVLVDTTAKEPCVLTASIPGLVPAVKQLTMSN